MALVEAERLTYTYGGRGTAPQLDSCSLAIGEGEMILVVGPSGGGKSTLLRSMNGLVPHFYGGTMSGRVLVGGLDTRDCTPAGLAHLVACVFQDPEAQIIASTVFEEVAFGLENLGVPPAQIEFRVHESLGAMGASHLAGRSTRTLSGGEMQRVAIAAAIAMRPSLLVLDEPTSQLDPSAAESLLELLRRVNEDSGVAVLMAEHRLERCYHWADRIVIMEDGRIVHDAPPAEAASFSVAKRSSFVPPVARMFAGLSSGALPLTVKQGRAEVRRLVGGCGVAKPEVAGTGCADMAGEASGSAAARPDAPAGIAVRGLRFTYPDGFEALRGCDITVSRGDFAAIMGENGAGKSTLVRHFNGLNRVQSGEVLLRGRSVRGVPVEELARECAVLGQYPNDYLTRDTVAEELEFSLAHLRPDLDAAERRAAADAALAALDIEELAAAEPRALSAGQRQRIAIAAMTVASPEVLVLDEPTRGLDWESKTVLGTHLRAMSAAGGTVVVVTHDVEFAAAFSEHTIVMGAGRVVGAGPTRDLLSSTMFLAPQVARVLGGCLGAGVVTVDDARRRLAEAVRHE